MINTGQYHKNIPIGYRSSLSANDLPSKSLLSLRLWRPMAIMLQDSLPTGEQELLVVEPTSETSEVVESLGIICLSYLSC